MVGGLGLKSSRLKLGPKKSGRGRNVLESNRVRTLNPKLQPQNFLLQRVKNFMFEKFMVQKVMAEKITVQEFTNEKSGVEARG